MSLISLLIALAAERYLSSSAWQFNFHFNYYAKLFNRFLQSESPKKSMAFNAVFIIIPVVLCYFLLGLVSDGLLHFLLSTLILISCFGCVKTRDAYKQYLMAAFRGEQTTCELHHQQLQQDKNLPNMGFGQILIWLNYRYFIAIMIFFVMFGAPGALFYRLMTKVNEQQIDANGDSEQNEECQVEANGSAQAVESANKETEQVTQLNQQILFYLDWLPVRIVAFGYMLVGHFSRAMPVWLENLFDVGKLPHNVLISVAEKSEDFMIDKEDCTAEPCLLVRLAKRSLLLFLAVIAILILTGIIS